MRNRNEALSEVRLSPADRAQIDAVCDEFEAAWRRVRRPRVKAFLPRCEPRLRDQLLADLLSIDRHWRSQVAESDRACDALDAQLPAEFNSACNAWEGGAVGLWPGAGRTSLGPFENLERVGEGGFGVVFRAWDSRHRRHVALKLPRFGFELSGQDFDRFLREAKAAGSLDHPGIARVWDSGRIAGVTYIAYQFIDGENLKARFEEVSRWPPVRVARLVGQLAETVQYAHDQGIVHRDIKPSNILLAHDNRPVLTDFGLALAVGGEVTRSLAARVGTLDYMSPEQASGASAQVDGRADLWSLGVLMYELLTGQKPFRAANDVEVLRAIVDTDPRSPRNFQRPIPRDLDLLTMRCLEKRRLDRLPSCKLLAEELRRVERGEPIVSRRVSFVERAVRWCRRNPKPVAAFSLILWATAFGAWSWGSWTYDTRQNENVVQQLQLQIETNNAKRRALLNDLLERSQQSVSLSDDDLAFIETRFLESSDPVVCRRAAELLEKHGWLNDQRYPPHSSRSDRCVDILKQILASESEALDAPLREELAAALDKLTAE